MRTYLEFLKIPGVKRLVVSALPGRLSYAMIALSTFFFVQDVTGSITLAGIATGVETITSSLTAGFRGNLIDKLGQTKPLSFFVPTWVALVILLSTVSTPTAIVAISGLIGLASPPVNLSTRPLWRVLVGAENLRTAYALDTTVSSSTTPTERMRITSSGNVGIGTTTPGEELTVVGSVSASSTIYSNTYVGLVINSTSYPQIILRDSGTTSLDGTNRWAVWNGIETVSTGKSFNIGPQNTSGSGINMMTFTRHSSSSNTEYC
jgi:hypothetical protein